MEDKATDWIKFYSGVNQDLSVRKSAAYLKIYESKVKAALLFSLEFKVGI
jgi:hypothetical protein